jgi:hypothetical protein
MRRVKKATYRGYLKESLAIMARFVFVLIGGVFKEPLMFTVGVFGVILFLKLGYSIIEDWSRVLDPFVTLGEVFSGVAAYALFVKKNFSAWRDRKTLASVVEVHLEDVRKKLQQISYTLESKRGEEDTIAQILFHKWIKTERFESVESDFVQAVDSVILAKSGLSEGRRVFIQYVIYDLFPLSRSNFLASLGFSDLTEGSPMNEFLSLFKNAISSKEEFDVRAAVPTMDLATAQDAFKRLSSGNLSYYRDRLKNPHDREALVAIAEQCIREGYTSVDQILKFRREQQPFKMLIKYDERFAYFERELKALALKQHSEEKAAELVQRARLFLNPLPFSRAIQKHDDILIRLLPRDYFVFVFDLHQLDVRRGIRDAKRFMEQSVIPDAREFHKQTMVAIRKIDKCFHSVDKPFTANYYLIDIDIETLVAEADNKSIPEGMKRILVQDVLSGGDFVQFLSAQDLHISKIVESMPLDALLFRAEVSQRLREFLRGAKLSIHKGLKGAGISFGTIYDKSQFKAKINKVTDAIYGAQANESRGAAKLTKKEIREAVKIIAGNASRLVTILEEGIGLN